MSKSYIAFVASEAFEKIRGNQKIMTKLVEFMPYYEFEPYHFFQCSSWRTSGLSVQDRYLINQEYKDDALNFLL